MNLKITKNGLTQWFLESFYAAVLVFWCPIMIRWTKSFISLFCQNGGLASARLNPAWTEPSNNPQRLPSSFDIVKYHPNTPRLSLRLPKTPPNSIRHYRHHRTSSKTFKVFYLVHQYMLNCKINGTVHIFFLKKSYLSPRWTKLPQFFFLWEFSHNIIML